jgi:hypothetical protein
VGRHRDLDRARAARVRAAEPDVLVNKAGKRLKGVQQGLNLQLNSWSPGRGLACSFFNSQATRPTDDQLFFCPPRARSRRLWAGAGERRRRASELLFAAPPVATRNGLAPPPPRGAPGTPEHRLHNLSKKGLQKPGISPKSPADYGTDPNNYIHDCGLITWQAPGVRVNTNALVTQNNLFNFHTSAIADHDVDNCVFSLNSISNCMFTEEDMGAYYQYFGSYTTLAHPHGNVIISNLFQSVGTNYNVSGGDGRNLFRPAVYLDEQSSNTLVSANQTIGCPTPSFLNLAFFNTISNNVSINTNSVAGYDCVRRYASSGTNDQSANNVLINNWDYGVATNVYDAATGSTNAYSTISNNITYSTNPAGIAGLPTGFITNNSTFPTLILQQVPGGNGVQAYTPP